MPIYHYSQQEKQAFYSLSEQDLLKMIKDDPLLVLELKKIEQSVNVIKGGNVCKVHNKNSSSGLRTVLISRAYDSSRTVLNRNLTRSVEKM